MTTLHLQVAARNGPDHPRGARAAAAVFVALYRLAAGLARALGTRPNRVAAEAQAVRELAYRHLQTEPRFASDLLAAADRHERLHGDA